MGTIFSSSSNLVFLDTIFNGNVANNKGAGACIYFVTPHVSKKSFFSFNNVYTNNYAYKGSVFYFMSNLTALSLNDYFYNNLCNTSIAELHIDGEFYINNATSFQNIGSLGGSFNFQRRTSRCAFIIENSNFFSNTAYSGGWKFFYFNLIFYFLFFKPKPKGSIYSSKCLLNITTSHFVKNNATDGGAM